MSDGEFWVVFYNINIFSIHPRLLTILHPWGHKTITSVIHCSLEDPMKWLAVICIELFPTRMSKVFHRNKLQLQLLHKKVLHVFHFSFISTFKRSLGTHRSLIICVLCLNRPLFVSTAAWERTHAIPQTAECADSTGFPQTPAGTRITQLSN